MRSVLVSAACACAAASIAAVPGTLHRHSAAHKRAVSWTRTLCGSPGVKPQADIITQWGAQVTPDAVLQEYPRPMMTRDPATTATNLNGLWEFALAAANDPIPFGQTLAQTILVPFPLEACLSGAFTWPTYSKYMFYRVLFDAPSAAPSGSDFLLHFGAVDWQASVYLNGVLLGNHSGGYDGFTFRAPLLAASNELIVSVFDPSDEGFQVEGKQRISAISKPGGDTYTPSSGIWQTVWLEAVPAALHVSSLKVRGDTKSVFLTVSTYPDGAPGLVSVAVSLGGVLVTNASGVAGAELVIPVPNPSLWHPDTPTLYDLEITLVEPSTNNADTVGAYVGLREIGLLPFNTPPMPPTGARVGYDNSGGDMPNQPTVLPSADFNLCWAKCNSTPGCAAWSYGVPSSVDASCNEAPLCWLKASVESWSTDKCRIAGDMGTPGGSALRPAINGAFTFLAGWLDQSWWPDGEYTAPSDAALMFDLQAVKDVGMNSVRLHQKVNSERWYYWADKLGVAVLQDAPQKYGGASAATVEPFLSDLKAMFDGRGNHPSIIQWELFNEGDCWDVFNVSAVVEWATAYDPNRLIDTNSGGGANDLHIGNVNDIHSYPWPGNPSPSATQYAMIGEFGGLGAFITGKEWAPGQCGTYLPTPTPADEAGVYVNMTKLLLVSKYTPGVSVSIYTQITDVENECDGFYNMDRSAKFSGGELAAVKAANQALIDG